MVESDIPPPLTSDGKSTSIREINGNVPEKIRYPQHISNELEPQQRIDRDPRVYSSSDSSSRGIVRDQSTLLTSPPGIGSIPTAPVTGTVPLSLEEEENAKNEGTNLFITGLAREVTEMDLISLFTRYGVVDKCQIMVDPHSRESRGFGFVNMALIESADRALADLNNKEYKGRVLSIEKARRKRPRTPTPGKYFGPPKPRGRGGYLPFRGDRYYGRPRYEDRRYDDYLPPYRRHRYDDRPPYRPRGSPRGIYGGNRYDDRDRERSRYPPPIARDYRDSRYERRPLPPSPPPGIGGPIGSIVGGDRSLVLPPRGEIPSREVRGYRDERGRYSPPSGPIAYRSREEYR